MATLQFMTVGVLALALCGCEAEQQEATATPETKTAEAPAPNVNAIVPPVSDNAAAAYAEARKCFLDVTMRTMTDDSSGGPSSVNAQMFDLFKQGTVQAGSRLGKTEAEVMNEFSQLIADEAARVGSMSQADQEQYILTTNSNAIRCMQRQRMEMSG